MNVYECGLQREVRYSAVTRAFLDARPEHSRNADTVSLVSHFGVAWHMHCVCVFDGKLKV